MTMAMHSGRKSRYTDVLDEPVGRLLTPIEGYEGKPLLPLFEAIKPVSGLFNRIDRYVFTALYNCQNPSDDLTPEESAAIHLYTMEVNGGPSLHELLNRSLRAEKRKKLIPWFCYLKLFLTALHKLPSEGQTVWHGVKNVNLSSKYQIGSKIVWWGVTSCTTNIEVLQSKKFLGKRGERTVFSIECLRGISIENHSHCKEKEVILMPGAYFQVVGQLNPTPELHIIQLKEITPPIPFVEPPFPRSVNLTPPVLANKRNIFSQFRSLWISRSASTDVFRKRMSSQSNSKWEQHGITVAGGNGHGHQLNQLLWPRGICIDDDQTIYIADWGNNRIVQWKYNAINGKIIAGENDCGSEEKQLHRPTDVMIDRESDEKQLHRPTDVMIDRESDCLIIADQENRRVMRWSRQDNTDGEMISSNIDCRGVGMRKNGYLYVSDSKKNEVRRWRRGKKGKGTLIAGGNGQGDRLDQLNHPTFIFVDDDESVYVSDTDNHRVMKWLKGAKEGIVVAGGNGEGRDLTQLSCPQGVTVDPLGYICVADEGNHRVMRWCEGEKAGMIIAGGNGRGDKSNQLYGPKGLSFDRKGNFYVVDCNNNRIQKFQVVQSEMTS